MVCLICMPSALGPVALGFWAYITGKSLMPMLQLPYSRKHWKIQPFSRFGGEKFGEWPNNGKWILQIP